MTTKRKLVVVAGPNNSVGPRLDRPHCAVLRIHGTPSPEDIGKTEFHGCIRLTNWNAVDLEARLYELGATTLVLCGALATHALEASARHAGDLGYQLFVVADACQAADIVDLRGRLWPAEDVGALALARLKGETATIVDAATTLRAAATAKVRQRRAAGRV